MLFAVYLTRLIYAQDNYFQALHINFIQHNPTFFFFEITKNLKMKRNAMPHKTFDIVK